MNRPDSRPPAPDLVAAESLIRRAIDERRPDLLKVIGNGELSIALRWTDGGHDSVIKRVPPFPTRGLADDYCALVREHLDDLAKHNVRCVTTDLSTLDRQDGSAVVYHCQPLLSMDDLADHVLRRSEPTPDHPLVVAVVDTIVRVVGAGVPLDSQFANWCWFEDEPWQLDFSTPLMLDANGDIRFDTTGFQREYPAPVRRLVYRELMKLAPRFNDVGFVLTDVVVQLYREGLTAWIDPFVEAVRARHGIDVSAAEAKKRFDEDAKFFPTLLRLKRVERAWMQRTRRRYDTLLPATTSFGR